MPEANAYADPYCDTEAVIMRLHNWRTTAAALVTVAIAQASLIGCQSPSKAQNGGARIPVPSWAYNTKQMKLRDGRTQVSFFTSDKYPSSRTRDFYVQWAAQNRWSQIAPATESLSSDSWVSFDTERGRVDQWITHWRSPDGQRSFRLALIHRGNQESQQVFVVESPFYVLRNEDVGRYMAAEPQPTPGR